MDMIISILGFTGSQNYNLDNENSDVDAKAIVVSSFNDLLKFQGESKEFSFGDGLLDVKDVRLMFEQFLKMNLNFLEILFTDDFVYNTFYEKEVLELRDMAEDIAASVFRVGEFLLSYLDRGLPFKEAMSVRSSEKEELIRRVREGSLDRKFVFSAYEAEIAEVNKFASKFTSSYAEKQNTEVVNRLEDLKRRIVKKGVREDILGQCVACIYYVYILLNSGQKICFFIFSQ